MRHHRHPRSSRGGGGGRGTEDAGREMRLLGHYISNTNRYVVNVPIHIKPELPLM